MRKVMAAIRSIVAVVEYEKYCGVEVVTGTVYLVTESHEEIRRMIDAADSEWTHLVFERHRDLEAEEATRVMCEAIRESMGK